MLRLVGGESTNVIWRSMHWTSTLETSRKPPTSGCLSCWIMRLMKTKRNHNLNFPLPNAEEYASIQRPSLSPNLYTSYQVYSTLSVKEDNRPRIQISPRLHQWRFKPISYELIYNPFAWFTLGRREDEFEGRTSVHQPKPLSV